jgi:hypothetical protein
MSVLVLILVLVLVLVLDFCLSSLYEEKRFGLGIAEMAV